MLTIRRFDADPAANVRPEVREEKELLGRERELMYKTLKLTGLRRNLQLCVIRLALI